MAQKKFALNEFVDSQEIEVKDTEWIILDNQLEDLEKVTDWLTTLLYVCDGRQQSNKNKKQLSGLLHCRYPLGIEYSIGTLSKYHFIT